MKLFLTYLFANDSRLEKLIKSFNRCSCASCINSLAQCIAPKNVLLCLLPSNQYYIISHQSTVQTCVKLYNNICCECPCYVYTLVFESIIHRVPYTLSHSQRTFYEMSSLFMSPWLHSMSPNPVVSTVSQHIFVLKYTAASIALSVTELFNSSPKLGSVPQQWKEAHFMLIPKVQVLKSYNIQTYIPAKPPQQNLGKTYILSNH